MTTALTARYAAQDAATDIRPFQVEVPQADLDDLHQRLASTRFPSKELVADASQGVQLATVQALTNYWATEHDWRTIEAKLNALPQFVTEIDGRRHPLHPRQVPARERAAAAHHPRLARLDHRDARGHRPAHRPDRVRRHRRGRLRRRHPLDPGLRLLVPADRSRVEPRSASRPPGGS